MAERASDGSGSGSGSGGYTPEDLRARCAVKLHPSQVRVSGRFTAILAYLLETQWTAPAITELVVCRGDGAIVVAHHGEVGCNTVLGNRRDLDRNLVGVADVAGLTAEELRYIQGRVQACVR